MRPGPCANADGTPKRNYVSKRTAERAAKRTRRAGPDGDTIHVYFCPDCHRFHVGHSTIKPGQ